MSGGIRTEAAPAPVGAYPHARRVGNLLFLSGVGPREPGTNRVPGNVHEHDGSLAAYDIEAQCRQVFANVRAVLEASGAEYFAGVDACRTTVGIDALPTPIAIELKCIAALPAEH